MGGQETRRHVSPSIYALCFPCALGKQFINYSNALTRCHANSSDADSDVLADYVLALIRADNPEAELKANATENLEDFLKDSTSASRRR